VGAACDETPGLSGDLHDYCLFNFSIGFEGRAPGGLPLSRAARSGIIGRMDDRGDTADERQAGEDLPPPPKQGFARLWARVPTCVLGLVLLMPVMYADHFEMLRTFSIFQGDLNGPVTALMLSVPLFIVGAVKRWNWRHILLMMGLAVLARGALWGVGYLAPERYFWAWGVFYHGLPIAILAVGEAWCRKRRLRPAALWIAAGAIAISAVSELVYLWLWLLDWRIPLSNPYNADISWWYSLAKMTRWPILVLLSWLVLPCCLRIWTDRARWARWAFCGILAVMVVISWSFIDVLSFSLAERSVLEGTPFHRDESVIWLQTRNRESDSDLFWQAIENEPWTSSGWQHPVRPQTPGDRPFHDYWRLIAVNALAERDSAGTAERLAAMLRQRPSVYLAEDAADVFVKNRIYDAVPYLMRFSLSDESSRCTDTLVEMGLPRASIAVIRQAIVFEASAFGRQLKKLDQEKCDLLKEMLGEDVGNSVAAWLELYDEAIADRPTPLPKDLQAETDCTIRALIQYILASNDLVALNFRRIQKQGLHGRAAEIALIELNAALTKPDWTVRTVGELEREVEDYCKRVNEAMAEANAAEKGAAKPPVQE